MVQQIINGTVPILVTALVAVLTVIIKGLGDAAVGFINEKITAVKVKAGADQWNHWMDLARSAWNMVDENFRITPTLEKTFAAKQAEFAAQIKKLIPEITDDQIEQLRQAVAGEINKGKAAIVGQTQDEQGNGLTTTDDAEAATTPAPQTDAQASPDEQATFPGIGNVTLEQIGTAIEAAKIAITKTTDAAELNTLNLSLSALQTLRTAKAAESKTAAPNSAA